MSTSKCALVVAVIAAASAQIRAQELLRQHDDRYGNAVTALGDVDGDGIADYAVQRSDPAAYVVEVVEVRSGRSGALIRSIPSGAPPATGWAFGAALADAGDVDADGVTDLLVGAMLAPDPAGSFPKCGAAFVYSGSDGHLLWSGYGGATGEWFGYSVAGLGDVDGDGAAECAVGQVSSGGSGPGVVTVFSGASGAPLYVFANASHVAQLSDHDHDGVRDFAIIGDVDALLVSGASGAILATISTSTSYWGSVAEVDDLDGDDEPELALGERDAGTLFSGLVRVVSVPTRSTLRLHSAIANWEIFGVGIVSGFDSDGDGVHDYLVSAPDWFLPTGSGSASLFSGRTGERLYRFVDPDAPYGMGMSVAGLADVDGDRFEECLVGSPFHHPPGTTTLGSDFVFRGNDLWLDAYPKSVAAGATESVAIHGAPNSHPVALFVIDFAGTPAFQLAAVGLSNSLEAFTVSGTAPAGLAGSEWTLRAYALDANGKLMVSADEVLAFN